MFFLTSFILSLHTYRVQLISLNFHECILIFNILITRMVSNTVCYYFLSAD